MAIWSFTQNLIKINIFKILPPKPLGKKKLVLVWKHSNKFKYIDIMIPMGRKGQNQGFKFLHWYRKENSQKPLHQKGEFYVRPWGRFENIFIEQVWIESFLFHNTQKSILGSHAQFIYTLYFQIVNIKKTNTVKKWYKVPVKLFWS